MTARRIPLALIFLLLIAVPTPPAHARQGASSAQPDLPPEFIAALDTACSNLAVEIQKRHFPSVSVFGAAWSIENFTELGSVIGDAVSSHLATKASGFTLVDRDQLRDKLEADRMSSLMALRTDSAQWLAGDLKIPAVVLVTLSDLKERLMVIHLSLFHSNPRQFDSNPGHDRPLADFKFDLPVSALLFESLHRSLLTADLIAKPPANKELANMVRGRSMPECTYCPRPDYTEDARRARWRGSILLSALVTPQGKATEILILESAPYLIDRSMVDDIKDWKFKPALDASTQPVAKRVQLTASFDIR